MIGSRKTETPTVWAGVVIIRPNVPAASATQP